MRLKATFAPRFFAIKKNWTIETAWNDDGALQG